MKKIWDRIRIASGMLTHEEVEMADAIIGSFPPEERDRFHNLFVINGKVLASDVDIDDQGRRQIALGIKAGPLFGQEYFFGKSAEMFDDRGRLTRIGRIVRQAWLRNNNPLREEFEELLDAQVRRRHGLYEADAREAQSDIAQYNALITQGGMSAPEALVEMRRRLL